MATKKKESLKDKVKRKVTGALMGGSGKAKPKNGDNLGSTRPGRNLDRYLEDATGDSKRRK